MKHYIKSHRDLHLIKVKLAGRVLTFHTFSDVGKGDRVEILGGFFKDKTGTVAKTRAHRSGYTFEARRVTKCPTCGRS